MSLTNKSQTGHGSETRLRTAQRRTTGTHRRRALFSHFEDAPRHIWRKDRFIYCWFKICDILCTKVSPVNLR